MPTDAVLQQHPACDIRERSWAATLHVLQAPALQAKGVMRFVDVDRQQVDWVALLRTARGWSGVERTLLTAAGALWGYHPGCELRSVVMDLDDPDLRRVLDAIGLYRPACAPKQGGVVSTVARFA